MNLALAARALSPLALVLLGGCSHVPSAGNVTSQPRTAGDFTRIDVRGPVDVVVHEGRALAMAVTTEGVAPNKVRTHIEGDALVVDMDGAWCVGICLGDKMARVDVDVPSLSAVAINGSGNVTVVGAGPHAKVDLEVHGSGDVTYAGSADLVSCRLEGSGDVTLNGTGKRVQVELTGSGDIDASAFAVEGGEFDLEGAGDVSANLHGGATAIRLRGSGDFHYTGSMKIKTLDVSGSGEIEDDGAERVEARADSRDEEKDETDDEGDDHDHE